MPPEHHPLVNHYDMLEVSPKASPAVIKAAYKSLIQRFHPDKNLGDPALARASSLRAGLINQAYETLSDPDKRATYDRGREQAAGVTSAASTHAAGHSPSRRRHTASSASAAEPRGRFSTAYFWLIVLLIIGSGSVSLWLLRGNHTPKPPSQPAPLRAVQQGQDVPPVPMLEGRSDATQSGPDIKPRTVSWTNDFSVVLADGRLLSIPAITLHLGAVDTAEFSRYLDTQQASIQSQLKDRLALAKPEELAQTSGQQYLRRSIFDALIAITGTRRVGATPAGTTDSAAAHGITGVSLPDAFSLR